MSTVDVMLDLETLGTSPGSIVLSIGAASTVRDSLDEQLVFSKKISVISSMRAGLTSDDETLRWWKSQPDNVWAAAVEGGEELESVLASFGTWLVELRSFKTERQAAGNRLRLWGDANSFDIVLLECAYKAAGVPVPWTYREEFDYRTLRSLFQSEKPPKKVIHDALSDARAQLEHLQQIIEKLRALGLSIP